MISKNFSPIEDEVEFRTKLHRLLLQAYSGGIFVEGGWACLNTDGTPSWDVEIVKVNKDCPSEFLDFDE